MRKKPVVIIMLFFICLSCLSGCGKDNKNQTLINFFGEEKYNELSKQCSDEEKILVANELIELARSVFCDTKTEFSEEEVGALKRYSYHNPNVTDVDISIELVTTEQDENNGYVWVRYSAMYYCENELVSGSRDILSRWTIERNGDSWYVTLIEEL